MSILDALKVQKAEQQSVRELAMLPQQMIIQMAQRGDIPAEVAPVVINEKARIAKEMANMQAMMARQAQGTPPTVLEQAMNANAQAENPQPPAQPPMQGMPQAPQAAPPQGLAGLPTPPGMFNEQSYAGGGIVAFAGQGRSDVSLADIVAQQQRQDPSFAGMFASAPEEPAAEPEYRRKYTSLADALRDVTAVTGGPRGESEEEKAWMEYQKGQKPRSKEEMDQQVWMRALEAGLGIMGGTSPYALANIGKGAEAAVKGYGEDVKEQAKRQAAFLQSAAQQARQKRLEGIEDVKLAEKLYEKDLESEYRQAVLSKSDRLDKSTKIYFDKMVAAGADPKDPNTMAAARDMAYSQEGLAARRIEQRQVEEEGTRANNAARIAKDRFKETPIQLELVKARTPEAQNAIRLRILNEERRNQGLPPLGSLPSDLSGGSTLSTIKGVPPGSKVGKLTPEGWEVLNSKGELIGHIKE